MSGPKMIIAHTILIFQVILLHGWLTLNASTVCGHLLTNTRSSATSGSIQETSRFRVIRVAKHSTGRMFCAFTKWNIWTCLGKTFKNKINPTNMWCLASFLIHLFSSLKNHWLIFCLPICLRPLLFRRGFWHLWRQFCIPRLSCLQDAFLYARSKTSDVLWYGIRPSVCPSVRPSVCLSVRPLATSCPLNILKSLWATVMILGRKIGHGK